jgi:hypothetical protein
VRNQYAPEEKWVYYQLGETTIPISIRQYGPVNGIVCINLHGNEETSVTAADLLLREHGGTMIRLGHSERLIKFRFHGQRYEIDPNGIFSEGGIRKTLKEEGRFSEEVVPGVKAFADRVLACLPSSTQWVIALHNNSEGHYSVKSYMPGGEHEEDARRVNRVKGQDDDDMIFTTDNGLFEQAVKWGSNAVLQNNERVERDGSLSVYFGEKKKKYANVETEHGKLGQYVSMLRKLLDYTKEGL